MNNKFVLLEAQEIEKQHFSILERLWGSLEKSQRNKIEEYVLSAKANGAICSEYEFVEASL